MSETTAKEVQVVDKPLVMLPGGKRRFFIAILYLMFCFDLFIRYGFSYVMPLIQDDLSLSNTQVGLMSSAIFLGMAIFVYPISFMGENHSQRRAISFCGILWSGATVVCGMAGGAVTLILSRLCVGAGSSAYAPLSTAMITSWFKKSQWGSALGLYNTAMIVGGALGTVIFAALGEALGWRACFYVISGISLVICLLSFLLPDNKKLMAEQGVQAGNDEADEVAQIKLNVVDTAKLLLSNKALLAMCLAAGMALFSVNTGSSFAAIYFQDVKGMTPTAASMVALITMPFSILATPIGGKILDKWYGKDKRARMWMPMLTCLLSAGLLVIGYGTASIPIIIAGNTAYTLGNTSFHASSHELVPAWYKSVSYGTYVFFIQIFGALGPSFGGWLIDQVGIQHGLVFVQATMLITAALLIYAGKVYLNYYNAARKEEEERGLGVAKA